MMTSSAPLPASDSPRLVPRHPLPPLPVTKVTRSNSVADSTTRPNDDVTMTSSSSHFVPAVAPSSPRSKVAPQLALARPLSPSPRLSVPPPSSSSSHSSSHSAHDRASHSEITSPVIAPHIQSEKVSFLSSSSFVVFLFSPSLFPFLGFLLLCSLLQHLHKVIDAVFPHREFRSLRLRPSICHPCLRSERRTWNSAIRNDRMFSIFRS